MVSIVKRNGVRLLSVLFILVILMGIVFVASTTNVFGLSYASEGVLKSDAKDAVTYSNQHDEENEELSLANVSSATASFLNWATFMAIKPDSPNQKMLDMIADLQHRVEALETADYVVWYAGKVTAKNEIVKFDLDGDGVYGYVTYAGGRSETSLSVGKIDGWYKVTSNGVKTHRITRNSDGTFTLTPVGE